MRVLVLGGTSFVGRAIVDDLLQRGHAPTIFNRGRTGPELFPGVERLIGDRDTGDYAALHGDSWEAVVDVCGFVPRHVEESVAALSEWSGRYVFISTGMVYDHTAVRDAEITESSPRLPSNRATEDVDDDSYGSLKVACEETLQARLGARLTLIRPTWVVGPHEVTDRLTYWVRRAADGRRTVVPARFDRPSQLIDVRDLARLVTLVIEQDVSGAFNAVGPTPAITFAELLSACGDAELVPVPDDELDFPLLFPDPAWDVMLRISAAAALEVGMPQTPLAQTIADTRAWDRARGEPTLVAGLSEEQEQALLEQAHATTD